ncbi:MAG: hypothetical protein PWR06_754 [Thermoanaerobacteraceae bacterium]|jgi:arsenite-transporting ATPase|nr:hypothetical protein [Thermoanaerobacteraceae bacterium]MDN5300874.1 hypothetical protein [Thermoanaerobacteraceae bacterium]
MIENEEETTPEKTPIIEAYRASEELKTVGIKTRMIVRPHRKHEVCVLCSGQ